MPKTFIVKLEVPSGSRPSQLLTWLDKLLTPHRMRAVEVTDDTALGDHKKVLDSLDVLLNAGIDIALLSDKLRDIFIEQDQNFKKAAMTVTPKDRAELTVALLLSLVRERQI